MTTTVNGDGLKGDALNEWWLNKLGSGQWGERQIVHHFISKGFKIDDISNSSEWDIESNGKRFEIKTNFYEYKKYRHPMIIIEVESNGVPSGLSVTTADYYILYYPFENMFYIESVENIKEMVASGKYDKVVGGRNNLATMYQVPRSHFKTQKELHFMDFVDNDTKSQEWYLWYHRYSWYTKKYGQRKINDKIINKL